MLLLFSISITDHLFGKELFIWFTVRMPFVNVYQFLCVLLFLLVLRVKCWI